MDIWKHKGSGTSLWEKTSSKRKGKRKQTRSVNFQFQPTFQSPNSNNSELNLCEKGIHTEKHVNIAHSLTQLNQSIQSKVQATWQKLYHRRLSLVNCNCVSTDCIKSNIASIGKVMFSGPVMIWECLDACLWSVNWLVCSASDTFW